MIDVLTSSIGRCCGLSAWLVRPGDMGRRVWKLMEPRHGHAHHAPSVDYITAVSVYWADPSNKTMIPLGSIPPECMCGRQGTQQQAKWCVAVKAIRLNHGCGNREVRVICWGRLLCCRLGASRCLDEEERMEIKLLRDEIWVLFSARFLTIVVACYWFLIVRLIKSFVSDSSLVILTCGIIGWGGCLCSTLKRSTGHAGCSGDFLWFWIPEAAPIELKYWLKFH